MRRHLGSVLALVLTGLLSLVVVAGPAHGGLPPLPTSPDGDPPGANVWSCRPTAAHPEPVVLVHGTFGDRKHLLEGLSQAIHDAGFCVFSLDYGNRGTGDIPTSARQLSSYVDRVLAATGASKVSLVGHSQGGMMPRYYIKFLGGAAKVDDLVGIVPSNHGTAYTSGGQNLITQLVGYACPACVQQGAGSAFLTRLNAGDETPGRVSYTQITTRYDEVVVPYRSAYLAPGPRTTNITIQDLCPFDLSDHLLLPTSRAAIAVTLDALTHPGPASPTFRPSC